ncbi:MAG: hypothetical protein U1E02_27895, partial [Hydrogenophaga sp.]|nr:hypothetical protein [Hydrogenophaga sp.]
AKKATGDPAVIPEAPVAPGEAPVGQSPEIGSESGGAVTVPADVDKHTDSTGFDSMHSQGEIETAVLAAS